MMHITNIFMLIKKSNLEYYKYSSEEKESDTKEETKADDIEDKDFILNFYSYNTLKNIKLEKSNYFECLSFQFKQLYKLILVPPPDCLV